MGATAGAITIRVDAPVGGMTDFASVLRGRPPGTGGQYGGGKHGRDDWGSHR